MNISYNTDPHWLENRRCRCRLLSLVALTGRIRAKLKHSTNNLRNALDIFSIELYTTFIDTVFRGGLVINYSSLYMQM